MIDALLGVGLIITLTLLLLQARKNSKNHKDLHRIAELTNKALVAQREINEAQHSMNSHIAQNLELLGVHTKLIKPTVAMQAEAFLAWQNRKDNEENG
jgi:hypothetical protein